MTARPANVPPDLVRREYLAIRKTVKSDRQACLSVAEKLQGHGYKVGAERVRQIISQPHPAVDPSKEVVYEPAPGELELRAKQEEEALLRQLLDTKLAPNEADTVIVKQEAIPVQLAPNDPPLLLVQIPFCQPLELGIIVTTDPGYMPTPRRRRPLFPVAPSCYGADFGLCVAVAVLLTIAHSAFCWLLWASGWPWGIVGLCGVLVTLWGLWAGRLVVSALDTWLGEWRLWLGAGLCCAVVGWILTRRIG